MTDQALRSIKVSGRAVVAGGQYDEVRGSGSIRFDGALGAQRVHASGSVSGHGSLETDLLETSGSLVVDGDLRVGDMKSSGSVDVSGDIEVRGLGKTSGALRIGGRLTGKNAAGSGGLRIGSEVALDQLSWSGAVHCPGLVSADAVDLQMAGESQIGELAGSSITVRPGVGWRFGRPPRLLVGEVSGDDIRLENTVAQVVRGDRVTIGPRCQIERLEYREQLEVSPEATVGDTVRIE